MSGTRAVRRHRRRWSREDKRAHLAALRISGISLRQYSERHGVPLSTLDLWRRQEKRSTVPRFAKVELSAPVVGHALALTVRRRDVLVEVTGLDQPGLVAALRSVLS